MGAIEPNTSQDYAAILKLSLRVGSGTRWFGADSLRRGWKKKK